MRKENRNKPNRRIWKKQYIIEKEDDSSNEDNFIEEEDSIKENNISNEDKLILKCNITKEQFDKDRIPDQFSLAPGNAICEYVDDWGNYDNKGIIKYICNNSGILNFGELYFHFLDAKNTKLGQNLANILTDDIKTYFTFSSMDHSYFGVIFKHITIRPTSFTIGAYNLNSFAIFGCNDLISDWTLIFRYANFNDGKIQTFMVDSTENYSIFVLMQMDQGKNGSWEFSIAHFDIDGDITTIEILMDQSSENDDNDYSCDLDRPGIESLNDFI